MGKLTRSIPAMSSMSSSSNLSGYHIPHLAPGAANASNVLDKSQSQRASPTPPPPVVISSSDNQRLLAPGKQSSSTATTTRPPKRRANGETTTNDVNDAKALALFPGRDTSYPDELNRLIGPLACELCKAQMTSLKCARDHYESKAHDRHISAWLAKNYTDAGLQAPPVKRLLRQGPYGPNAFHCDLCDLDLTSATHARQHYQGRKHKLVEQRGSRPSGAGYYNAAGKWVRTGSKFETKVSPDGRYGIGMLFLKTEATSVEDKAAGEAGGVAGGAAAVGEAASATGGAPSAAGGTPATGEAPSVAGGAPSGGEKAPSATGEAPSAAGEAPPEARAEPEQPAEDRERTCSLCKIVVTSANQMQMHLDGARHQSKLRNAGLKEPTDASPSAAAASSAADNPESLDLLLYRTPTGQYYCKPCNKMMNHVTTLQQHLVGKKHLKTAKNAQQAEKAVLKLEFNG